MSLLTRLLLSRESAKVVSTAVDRFAKMSPAIDKRGRIAESHVEVALSAFYSAMREHVEERRLGIWRRAALAKAVQNELLARGYPIAMVNKIISALAINALVKR